MKTNEFIILQKDCFDEFRSYVENKNTEMLCSGKGSSRGKKDKPIILCFPSPEAKKEDFDQFFISPLHKDPLDNGFSGCFAVELTEYLRSPKDKHLSDLALYMKENSNMYFILFTGTDGSKSVTDLANHMTEIAGCKVGEMDAEGIKWQKSLPDNKKPKTFGY